MKETRTYTMSARADGISATRERIIRNALELFFAQWYEDVTLAAIAKAAGVSHQTVLNHFESKEGVAHAAFEVLAEEIADRRFRAVPGDIDNAVNVIVSEYERYGDANARWAATSERLGSIAELLDGARAAHRSWIEHVFESHLATDEPDRRRTVNAVYAATDVYTWKLLRRDLHLSRAETERTMAALIAGVLDRTTDPKAER